MCVDVQAQWRIVLHMDQESIRNNSVLSSKYRGIQQSPCLRATQTGRRKGEIPTGAYPQLEKRRLCQVRARLGLPCPRGRKEKRAKCGQRGSSQCGELAYRCHHAARVGE